MQAMKIVNLNHISLRFSSQKWLFKDLNFKLMPNQFTCLLGSSGVGKSTLLHLIAGLIQPDIGNITPLLKGKVSYLTQQDSLLPWLNIVDNVLIGYRLRGESARVKELMPQAKELLAQVGLSHAEKLLPAQLSGGMKQRVVLIRTWLEDRPLVLMDEPFSALDVITRLQLQTLTAQILENKTVLIVTHDPLEALRLGHHVYIMRDFPAQIIPVSVPATAPLRDIQDPQLLILQAELLQRLSLEVN